ncbi:hypothetical protein Plec18167_006027 [Paecilomyces lecythidis]|uniref:Uncharacterized protein n=1 Tax=Paecilomyces lecythidis TaxID=3004212 RepID=A0ABR3XEN0_9EURO
MCRHTIHRYHGCKHIEEWGVVICPKIEALEDSKDSDAERDAKSLRKAMGCSKQKVYNCWVTKKNRLIMYCPRCTTKKYPQTTISAGAKPHIKRVAKKSTGIDRATKFIKSVLGKEPKATASNDEDWEEIFLDDAEVHNNADDDYEKVDLY